METLAVDLKEWALWGCLALAALSLLASLVIAWKVLDIEKEQSGLLKDALGDPDKAPGLAEDIVGVLKTLPLKMRYAGLLVIAALLFALGGLLGAGLVDVSLGDTTPTTTGDAP